MSDGCEGIDSLVSIGTNLVSGSEKGILKLWNCQAVHHMKEIKKNKSRY